MTYSRFAKYLMTAILLGCVLLIADMARAESRIQLTLTFDKTVSTVGEEFYYLTLSTDYVPGRVYLTIAGKLTGGNGSLSLDGSCILTVDSTYSCRLNVDGARFKVIVDPATLKGQPAGFLGKMDSDFKVQDQEVRILTLFDVRQTP